MKTTPYWTDRTPRPEDVAIEELPPKADVLVVGAGITGLTAARTLADLGRSVVVVDAARLGDGASAINGGQVGYGYKAAMSDLVKRHGIDIAREMWDGSLRAIDRVEQITEEDGFDADFHRTGFVSLGYRKDSPAKARATSRFLRDTFGFETAVLEGDEIASVTGSDRFTVAVVDTAGAAIDPAKYTFGLARGVARRGVPIVEDCEVRGLYRSGGTHFAATAKGTVEAGDVLIATNGYTPRDLVPAVRRQVVPIGSYMVATVPIPEETRRRLFPGDHLYWTQRRFLNYFRIDDGRLLMGGRPDLSPDLDIEQTAEAMSDTITYLFPELDGIELTHTWGGKLAATFDLLPHLGTTDGIWYALGYGGHGLTLATYLGTEVGNLIGGAAEHSPFLGLPHPTRLYYRGSTWFLPAGGMLFRGLDRIGR